MARSMLKTRPFNLALSLSLSQPAIKLRGGERKRENEKRDVAPSRPGQLGLLSWKIVDRPILCFYAMLARRSSSVSGAMEIDNEKACSNRAGREIRRCRFRYNYNVVEWWELWGYDDWIVRGMGDSLEGALFDRFIYFFGSLWINGNIWEWGF